MEVTAPRDLLWVATCGWIMGTVWGAVGGEATAQEQRPGDSPSPNPPYGGACAVPASWQESHTALEGQMQTQGGTEGTDPCVDISGSHAEGSYGRGQFAHR